MLTSITIGLWNVAWAAGTSRRGAFFRERWAQLGADVLAVTEGFADLFPPGGHTVTAGEDYGYRIKTGRRKVLLWSRAPWTEVDTVGHPELPGGRFVAATTETPLGPVRFIGVCIPWKDAHVRSGRGDRRPWEDHLTYLRHLPAVIRPVREIPVVVLGDFNQRVPRQGQPPAVFTALCSCFAPPLRLITSGEIPGAPERAIDHIAIDPALAAERVDYLDPHDQTGAAMSDHFGIKATLVLPPPDL